MKKLTAGIFATILGVTAMGAADAAVTSKGYVDAALATKANASEVSTLSSTVSGHTTAIADLQDADTTLQGNIDAVALVANAAAPQATTYTKTEVDNAIAAVDGAASVQALTGRVTTAEGEIDALQTKTAGLGSAAYTESTAYATAAQGATADATAQTVAGYGDIVTHDASEFATAAQGAKADTAVQPAAINDMATKTWVGTQNYVDETELAAKGYLTEHQSLADYAKTADVVTNEEFTTFETSNTAAIAAAQKAGDDAAAAAATADGKAVAAQAAAEAAQATANAAIKAPAACSDPTNMCVLVSNGTTVSWQVIANVYPDNNGTLN